MLDNLNQRKRMQHLNTLVVLYRQDTFMQHLNNVGRSVIDKIHSVSCNHLQFTVEVSYPFLLVVYVTFFFETVSTLHLVLLNTRFS